MTNNKTGKRIWLWLLPAAAVLTAAVVFGFSLPHTTAVPVESSPAPIEEIEIAPTLSPGYFPVDSILFTPEAPFTRGMAAEIFSALTGEEENFGLPLEEGLTESALHRLLRSYFDTALLDEAMALITGRGDETVTRAEAVVCLNRLFNLAPAKSDGYFPDVAPEHWAYGHILTAATAPSQSEKLTPGFVNLDGWLYCADSRGYFRTNTYIDALYFDPNGRYTCGNSQLDAIVAQVIAENTTVDMTREEMLRAMYEYVRDNFAYMRRNYYKTGDVNWQIQEALTMYTTGKGNCYCYAAAFWAAARGLGYSAKIVSGTVGAEDSPHGWVEIVQSGERYTYDVELEMAMHRDGYHNTNLYEMPNAKRRSWNYVGADYSDDKFHRETTVGVLPG